MCGRGEPRVKEALLLPGSLDAVIHGEEIGCEDVTNKRKMNTLISFEYLFFFLVDMSPLTSIRNVRI